MNKNTIYGLLVVIVLLFGGYYFYNSQQKVETPQEETNTEQKVPAEKDVEEMVVEDTKAREIIVEGSEFKYNPSAISVKEGEKVSLTFKNVGTAPHNFVSDELNINSKTLNPGEEETIDFVADKSGAFTFYCSIGNHREQGMEGEVVVE